MPPLKITVANSQILLSETANDRLAETLARALRQAGYRVSRLRLPLPPSGSSLAQHLAAVRLFDLDACDGEPADRLIALDLLSACLRHPRKILWIADLFGGLQHLGDDGLDSETLRRAARLFLTESHRRLATSNLSGARLQALADLGTQTVRPPLSAPLPLAAELAEPNDVRSSEDLTQVLLMPPESGYFPIDRIREVMSALDGKADILSYHRIGQRPDARLVQQIEDQRLPIRWLGEVADESIVLAEVDSIWLGGAEEYSPWPVWSALATGKPTVTWIDAGASAEILKESGLGRVVGPQAEGMVDALLQDETPSEAGPFLKDHYPTWSGVIELLLQTDHRFQEDRR